MKEKVDRWEVRVKKRYRSAKLNSTCATQMRRPFFEFRFIHPLKSVKAGKKPRIWEEILQ